MKRILALNTLAALVAMVFQISIFGATQTNCWLTAYSGQYARIYTNDAMLAAGTTITTWSNGSQTQANPAYCGIQEIYWSSNWVYIRSTGLASYKMGPWQNGSFPNLPSNQKVLYRFPLTNDVPAAKSANGGGQIGIFVDGVAMFNSWDAFTWDPSTSSDESMYSGYWNRDAYVNEGATFDPGYAHQQNTGTYHYHADPIALRYLLGDHVDYNPVTKTYSESTNAPTQHSPILAWTADGFPLYGPYGYSNPTNPASGIRRMISGYVLRNGQDGTVNLTNVGRTTIPQWAVRLYSGVSASQSGAPVNANYPVGRYMEDNDYLGDCTNVATGTNYQQGVDYDLDEYNGRWCFTPDFPKGTYAYFVAINSNGVPAYPYNIGRGYYGSPAGGIVSGISETVVTNFLGYTNLPSVMNLPAVQNSAVTLTWSALEGGSYTVQSTTNLTPAVWSIAATGVAPDQITGDYTNNTAASRTFYRVARTSVATYDSAGTTTFGSGGATGTGILSVSPASVNPGTNFTLTLYLDPSVNPPPATAPINSITLGAITGTNNVHVSQTEVTSKISIPAGTPAASPTVSVVFPGPPMNPSQAVTYTLTGGFTIK